MLPKEFFNPVSGPCVFTVELSPTLAAKEGRTHYTFKITHKDATEDWAESYFVALLTGRDNESDYTYLGKWHPDKVEVKLTRASKFTDDSLPVKLIRRVLVRVFAGEGNLIEEAGFRVHHEGKCGMCGRVLTVPESIERGIGPECWKRLHKA